jgi:hypothetical protein
MQSDLEWQKKTLVVAWEWSYIHMKKLVDGEDTNPFDSEARSLVYLC